MFVFPKWPDVIRRKALGPSESKTALKVVKWNLWEMANSNILTVLTVLND